MSVSEANAYVKQLLDDDATLADLWVRGEVGEARTYASGHTYFTLRDGTSQLRCVLFRQQARRLEPLECGRQYLVRGAISVYEARGEYQLYVTDHRPVGTGELYLEFERLKQRLEAEGLFAAERKRPLPRYPLRIGIATSPDGAVIHDLCTVIRRRFPVAEVLLAPCQVQGAEAVRTIVAALKALDQAGVEVIVLARGGGSIEDLWAFNDEAVARAIAAARVPVVSAVGHETDFTIADFVADLRAPTPSAAAELLTPDGAALDQQLATLVQRAGRALQAQLWMAVGDLERLEARLQQQATARLDQAHGRLATLAARLEALSPLRVLARGYAVVRDQESGSIIRDAEQVAPGCLLHIQLAHGALVARVATQPAAAAPHTSSSQG